MIGKEVFLEIMNRRYACKSFDTSRNLTNLDVSFILECARLSPSSFGLEHWHLYAVRTTGKKQRLYSACFSQDAVGTASLAVVAVCRKSRDYNPESEFVHERGSRFPGGLQLFLDDYSGYYQYLESNALLDHWARAQCYIACANMMTGAASTGIDSCAIEGFDNEKVLSLLSLDPMMWQTGIITVFGYGFSVNTREKIRMPASRICTYV